MLRALAVFAFSFFLLASSAIAADLTKDQAQKFIDAMEDVSVLSESMRKSGHDKEVERLIQAQAISGGGAFSPLLQGMPIMKKKFPADYKSLEGIVSKHGFSNPEDWAKVGDRVMLSYMAIKAEANPQMMEMVDKMPQEKLDAMPPEARMQFAQARLVMKAAAAIPAADRDIVRPFVPAIEADMQKTAQAIQQDQPAGKAP